MLSKKNSKEWCVFASHCVLMDESMDACVRVFQSHTQNRNKVSTIRSAICSILSVSKTAPSNMHINRPNRMLKSNERFTDTSAYGSPKYLHKIN